MLFSKLHIRLHRKSCSLYQVHHRIWYRRRSFFLPTLIYLQNELPICPEILDQEPMEVFLLVLYALFFIDLFLITNNLLLLCLFLLGTVFRTALLPVFYTCSIKAATYYMVTNSRKVFYPAATK